MHGDRSQLTHRTLLFNKEFMGVARNPQSTFCPHLYVFGQDFNPKGKKTHPLFLRQMDSRGQLREFNLTRRKSDAAGKLIREVTLRFEQSTFFAGVLFGDGMFRVLGWKLGEFGVGDALFDEEAELGHLDAKNTILSVVSQRHNVAEVLYAAKNKIYSAKINRENRSKHVFLKNCSGSNFLLSQWKGPVSRRNWLFYEVDRVEEGATQRVWFQHDLDNKTDSEPHELSKGSWKMLALRHYVVFVIKDQVQGKNTLDCLEIVDPVNNYVAKRYMRNDLKIRTVLVDNDELLFVSEDRKGRCSLKVCFIMIGCWTILLISSCSLSYLLVNAGLLHLVSFESILYTKLDN